MSVFCRCGKCEQRRINRAIIDRDSEPGAWADAMKFPPYAGGNGIQKSGKRKE